jgi:exopolyphosphatase/guanosine-5'-triphosphate,3'-diphosphate pyrophosphatase
VNAPGDQVATIDVGTNALLLLVARRERNGRLLTLIDRATVTGLGRGVGRSGALAPDKVEATLRVFHDYVEQARAAGVTVVRAVGTSALREASNANDFLGPAAQLLGTPVEVITGRREAELTFRGSIEGLDLDPGEVTVLDIGGGSTEIVRGEPGRLRQAASLDLGSVRLYERHVDTDPPAPQQVAALREDIREALAHSPVQPTERLVGIAGNVTTVAALIHAIDPYDPDRVHGQRVSGDEIAALAERLSGMTMAERKKLPGIEPGRADVIVAGTLLLLGIVEHAGAGEVIVSNGGVRVGLALELTD